MPDVNFCGSAHSVTGEQSTREPITNGLGDEIGRDVSRGAIVDRPHGCRHGHGGHPCLLAGRDIREVDTEAVWDSEPALRPRRREPRASDEKMSTMVRLRMRSCST